MLPGDHVDVVLTQPVDKRQINDVVILNVRVLAVDQLADERAEKPAVSRTVTLEVNEIGGQKLALASKGGSLWLLLRKPGDGGEDAPDRQCLI